MSISQFWALIERCINKTKYLKQFKQRIRMYICINYISFKLYFNTSFLSNLHLYLFGDIKIDYNSDFLKEWKKIHSSQLLPKALDRIQFRPNANINNAFVYSKICQREFKLLRRDIWNVSEKLFYYDFEIDQWKSGIIKKIEKNPYDSNLDALILETEAENSKNNILRIPRFSDFLQAIHAKHYINKSHNINPNNDGGIINISDYEEIFKSTKYTIGKFGYNQNVIDITKISGNFSTITLSYFIGNSKIQMYEIDNNLLTINNKFLQTPLQKNENINTKKKMKYII